MYNYVFLFSFSFVTKKMIIKIWKNFDLHLKNFDNIFDENFDENFDLSKDETLMLWKGLCPMKPEKWNFQKSRKMYLCVEISLGNHVPKLSPLKNKNFDYWTFW